MPRYRTPHWTDGRIAKLHGSALTRRFANLAEVANKYHRICAENEQSALDCAKKVGDALTEAKRRCGHRKKWSKWRSDNFAGSKETSCHYMRIAREWNNPKIREAMARGEIKSINQFLAVLRRKGNPKSQTTAEQRHVIRLFTKLAKDLNWADQNRLAMHSTAQDVMPKLSDFLLEVLKGYPVPHLVEVYPGEYEINYYDDGDQAEVTMPPGIKPRTQKRAKNR